MKTLASLVIISAFAICSVAQEQKIIEWPMTSPQPAMASVAGGNHSATDAKGLEIVEFVVEGKTITPGDWFSAGDDWLKTLGVKIKNVSDKKITSIRFHFGLPEAKNEKGSSGFSLEYGKELSTGIDYGLQAAIEPGQEVLLLRSDRHYARDRDGIANRTGVTTFKTVVVGYTAVKFEDGSSWMSYRLPMAATQDKK